MQHGRLPGDLADELLHEARLPDPGRAQQRQQMTGSVLQDARERAQEGAQLLLAPDERRVEAASTTRDALPDCDELQGVDRLASLDDPVGDRLRHDGVAHEVMGRVADQDLARRGGLLETLGDVHDLARDEQVTLQVVTRDHLAAVDADAALEADAPGLLELLIERRERRAHLERGPHGAERIVLVDDGNAENREHGVADELLDRAAVAFDDGPASPRSSATGAARSASGSSCRTSRVDSTRSAKRTVTGFRTSGADLSGPASSGPRTR